MINIKEIIAKEIEKVTKLNSNELESYIEKPKEAKNGDYAFPCFRLAKELKKAPQEIAKEIVKGNYLEFIKLSHDDLYEEKIIHGLIIGYIKEDFKVIINLLDTYIPCIDNWAVNDTVCANLKIFKNNQEGYRYIKKLLKSKEPFTIRFALVLLLDFYVNEEYIDKILKIINEIKHDNYYVKMANAWALSICYIKYPEKTIPFLKKNNLDKWTQNKAISKIKDSKRVAKEEKLKIDKLKK